MKQRLQSAAFLVGLFAMRSVLADQYYIPSGSMEPTIQIGDHVIVNKLAYDLRLPFTSYSLMRMGEAKRGEVIVFRDPRDPHRDLIKRLVGLPGDHVHVESGLVTINGRLAESSLGPATVVQAKLAREVQPFVYKERLGEAWHPVQRLPERAETGPGPQEFDVPPGQYFFLGDNRDNSADSRYWGFAPREALEGHALRVIYSVHWDGWIPRPSFARAGLTL